MPDIRYVCLSDTHFGASNSLLTNLKTASSEPYPLEASPVLKQLAACLASLISQNEDSEQPTLILNGDILELALNTTDQAAMAFTRFLEQILPKEKPLFREIIYIPGNHDHHLWEIDRETQYLNYITSNRAEVKLGTALPVPWHATGMFIKRRTIPVPCHFLMGLAQRLPHVRRNEKLITTFYPNFGLLHPNRTKCVIFHHGHFIESLYHLMSWLRKMIFPGCPQPTDVWDIEAENFAWIDFFWSTMGRSGDVGRDVGLIYELMQHEKQRKRLLSNLAKSLAQEYDLPGWGDRMEAKILEWVFHAAEERIAALERHQTKDNKPLSEEAEEGLWEYVEGPLRKQVVRELGESLPSDVTIVLGHTHKPFEEDLDFDGYPEWVNTYNTGGWILDTVDPQPVCGAAAVLVDEELNAVSLRLYSETADGQARPVSVARAAHTGEPEDDFYQRVSGLVSSTQDPWKTFSETVAEAVAERKKNLRARIKSRRR